METITKTIGGDRLGSGAKMNVDLKTFNRSTHDLSYIWKNTQAPGTLVPFMKLVALPGDTFDINLYANVLTHPTRGPLFGSFKLQLDVFTVPMRIEVTKTIISTSRSTATQDRKSTRLNSSHSAKSRMPSSA